MHNACTDELMNPLSIVNWKFCVNKAFWSPPMEILMDFSSFCAAFITRSDNHFSPSDVIFIFSYKVQWWYPGNVVTHQINFVLGNEKTCRILFSTSSHVVCFSNAISHLQHSITFLDLEDHSAASCLPHSGSVGYKLVLEINFHLPFEILFKDFCT